MESNNGEIYEIEQQVLEILDDLTPYIGLWVAVKEGRVVWNGSDPAEILTNPNIPEASTLIAVQDHDIFLYQTN